MIFFKLKYREIYFVLIVLFLYNIGMKKIFILAFMTALCWACNNTPSVQGEWTKPVPLQKGKFHGMRFEQGGKAQSINIPQFQYETWQQKGNKLTLTGKMLYGGESFLFTESYTIKAVNPAMLILINNAGEEIVYARKQ